MYFKLLVAVHLGNLVRTESVILPAKAIRIVNEQPYIAHLHTNREVTKVQVLSMDKVRTPS